MRFAEKDRFLEIMYPIQIDTLEENGMQTFRELRSMKMEQLELLMFVQGASDPIR